MAKNATKREVVAVRKDAGRSLESNRAGLKPISSSQDSRKSDGISPSRKSGEYEGWEDKLGVKWYSGGYVDSKEIITRDKERQKLLAEFREKIKEFEETITNSWQLAGFLENQNQKVIDQTISFICEQIDEVFEDYLKEDLKR